MGRMGSFSISGMKELQKELQKLQPPEEFIEGCTKELAAKLLRRVVKRTPVGDYTKEVEAVAKKDSKKHKKGDVYKKRVKTGDRVGGTLRRGWTGGVSTADYTASMQVNHVGSTYRVDLINNVKYASYVEYGHRQTPGRYIPELGVRLKKGFVEGKHMVEESEKELKEIAPAVLERRVKKYLGGIGN